MLVTHVHEHLLVTLVFLFELLDSSPEPLQFLAAFPVREESQNSLLFFIWSMSRKSNSLFFRSRRFVVLASERICLRVTSSFICEPFCSFAIPTKWFGSMSVSKCCTTCPLFRSMRLKPRHSRFLRFLLRTRVVLPPCLILVQPDLPEAF